MNPQQILNESHRRMQSTCSLQDLCDIAVESAQQIYQCNHVVMVQVLEKQQPDIKAEVKKGQVTISASDASLGFTLEKDTPQSVLLVGPIGQFILDYVTFPIFVTSSCKLEMWGYLICHQSSSPHSRATDVQEWIQRLVVQLGAAIQQLDVRYKQNELKSLKKELEDQKITILRHISHNYRTPLTKILAAAATLEKHGDALDSNTQRRFLKLIQDQVRHLTQITEKVLDAS